MTDCIYLLAGPRPGKKRLRLIRKEWADGMHEEETCLKQRS